MIVNYDTLISNGAHFEWQIINGNTTLKDNLISGKISMVLYEQASIGNAMARQLDFEYFKESIDFDASLPLVLQYRAVLNDDTSEWRNKGTYWIDKLDASPYSDKASVTAFDALLKANVTWLESGTFTTTTDQAIVNGIASDIGASIEANTATSLSTPITINTSPSIGANGTTSVEMLSYIGVMRGGNWVVNSDNELELIPLFDARQSVNIGDAVTNFDASPAEEITRVCIWSGDNNYYRSPSGLTDSQWEELGGRVLEAKCYIGGDQALADSLYDTFSGSTYYPYTTDKAWVDPKFELGDTITIKDITSIISNQTMSLTALASSSLSAKGQERVTSNYPTPTPTERKIAQNEAKTQASITILGDRIDATVQAVDGMQTQVTQNSEGLEAVTQRIDESESYLRWDGTTATLSIGESTSPTEAQVSPNGFSVVQNGETILTAQNQKVSTTRLEATETLTVGRYQWLDEQSKGYSLIYLQEQ